MLMAQWGVYIPAAAASVSPCDNIYTHFPADENETVDPGRPGEESQRLSNIFKTATRYSLLLLNESLATTSVAEGVFIAKGVVKSMRYLGVRAIFNTHMHELATSVGKINTSVQGDSRIESLITGMHDGERSFKVSIAPPQGVSYAADIAEKYGVTFEQIKDEIDGREQIKKNPQTFFSLRIFLFLNRRNEIHKRLNHLFVVDHKMDRGRLVF